MKPVQFCTCFVFYTLITTMTAKHHVHFRKLIVKVQLFLCFLDLFCVDALCPSQQIISHVGTIAVFLSSWVEPVLLPVESSGHPLIGKNAVKNKFTLYRSFVKGVQLCEMYKI